MKKFNIIFFMFFVCNVWSQIEAKHSFFYKNTPLEKILENIEQKFNISYSYVVVDLEDIKISIPKKSYTLDEINNKIEQLTPLKIKKLDSNFYAIIKNAKEEEIRFNFELEDVLVIGLLSKGIDKTTEKVIISPQKIETLPGVTDADLLLTLQQLPSVKSPNETSSGLNVQGGSSDQNLLLWDDIRLYHPGHLFGMITAINPAVEQKVNFYNKAFNPAFGERISSIIDIKTSNIIEENIKVNAGINALNADVYVKLPLIKNKLGLQLSARKSFTELLQSPTFKQFERKVFQNTSLHNFNENNQLGYQDYSFKLNFKPNNKTELSTTAIFIDNQLNYQTNFESSTKNQNMDIRNYGLSSHWNQKYTAKFKQNLTFFYSVYDFNYLKKETQNTNNFEAFKKLNRIVDSGVECDFSYDLNEEMQLDFGYHLLGNDVSHLYNTFNQDIGIDLSLKQNYNLSHIGYASWSYNNELWKLNFGTRFNNYSTIKQNTFEPRILIQRNLTNEFIWQISYDKKSQILSQITENTSNDLSLENYIWSLSDNLEIPIQKLNQYSSSLLYKKSNWLVDFEFYYKKITGITSNTFGFRSQSNTLFYGNGFVKGFDVLLQKKASNWQAWMTYSYQDAQNKFEGLNNSNYYSTNTNIKHAFSASFFKKWNNYSLTFGWFWRTGRPFSLLDANQNWVTFNSEQLPNYHRLDISGSYKFYEKESKIFKVGFSIYNVYNRKELISKDLQQSFANFQDFTVPKYQYQDFYSLGITPNILLRIQF